MLAHACWNRSLPTHSLCIAKELYIPTLVCVAKSSKYVWVEVFWFVSNVDDVAADMADDMTADMANDVVCINDVANDLDCTRHKNMCG